MDQTRLEQYLPRLCLVILGLVQKTLVKSVKKDFEAGSGLDLISAT
jgi:hypothetical protein